MDTPRSVDPHLPQPAARARRAFVGAGATGLALALVARSLSQASAQDATPTSDLEANKELARRFHDEIFAQGNLDVADEILAPDFVWRSPPQEAFATGPEEVKQVAADLREFFPDLILTDDDIIAEGDRVVIRWTLQGTAQMESGPVPVIYTGIDIFRIANGKLAELWQNTDDLGLQEQLAAAAATPAASP